MTHLFESEFNDVSLDAGSFIANRRKEGRVSTFIPAEISTSATEPPIRCAVVGLSKSGARVNFQKQANLPEQVLLHIKIPKKEMMCKVIWTYGTKAGLVFLK